MASEEGKQRETAPIEGGHEENTDPRLDAKEAVAAEEVAVPKMKAPKKKRGPKMQLVHLKLERLVLQEGELTIAVPQAYANRFGLYDVLEVIDEVHGLEEFVEDYDDMNACDIPIKIADFEKVDGDAETARFTVTVNRREQWVVKQKGQADCIVDP